MTTIPINALYIWLCYMNMFVVNVCSPVHPSKAHLLVLDFTYRNHIQSRQFIYFNLDYTSCVHDSRVGIFMFMLPKVLLK